MSRHCIAALVRTASGRSSQHAAPRPRFGYSDVRDAGGAGMHRVGLILPRDFQLLSLAPLTAFELAALQAAGPRYDLHLLSERGGSWRSSSGVSVDTEKLGDPTFGTL